MRIRKPFFATFGALVVFAGYIGLAPIKIPNPYTHSDKLLHFFTFFLLTLTFYWSFETSRRRAIHLTLIVVTGLMSIASEVVQGLIDNGRDFDILDIAGNALGSCLGVFLCSLYHKRMLERKRAAKGFTLDPGDDEEADVGLDELSPTTLGAGALAKDEGEVDAGTGAQESGVVSAGTGTAGVGAGKVKEADLDQSLDNWDENAADEWDEDEEDGAKKVMANGDTK